MIDSRCQHVPSLLHMMTVWLNYRRRITRGCRKRWTVSCPFGRWLRYRNGGGRQRRGRVIFKGVASLFFRLFARSRSVIFLKGWKTRWKHWCCCVFPGLIFRNQEADGQAGSPGPSPAAVVSNRPVCSPRVCVCVCVNTRGGNFILENTAACINTLFLSGCRIISSNRSHIVKLPLSRVGKVWSYSLHMLH